MGESEYGQLGRPQSGGREVEGKTRGKLSLAVRPALGLPCLSPLLGRYAHKGLWKHSFHCGHYLPQTTCQRISRQIIINARRFLPPPFRSQDNAFITVASQGPPPIPLEIGNSPSTGAGGPGSLHPVSRGLADTPPEATSALSIPSLNKTIQERNISCPGGRETFVLPL